MGRFGKWRWLLYPLVLLAFLFILIHFSSFDHTSKLAQAVLFQPNSNLDQRAFSAAINARFPPGTNPERLVTFVESLNGYCTHNEKGKLHCSLDESGAFCVVNKIGLDVELNDSEKIEVIKASEYFLGC